MFRSQGMFSLSCTYIGPLCTIQQVQMSTITYTVISCYRNVIVSTLGTSITFTRG